MLLTLLLAYLLTLLLVYVPSLAVRKCMLLTLLLVYALNFAVSVYSYIPNLAVGVRS